MYSSWGSPVWKALYQEWIRGVKQQLGYLVSTSYHSWAHINLERRLHILHGLPFILRIQSKHLARTNKPCTIWFLTTFPHFLITPCLCHYVLITLASFFALKDTNSFPAAGTFHSLSLLHGNSLLVPAQRPLEAPWPASQSNFSRLLFSSSARTLANHWIAFIFSVFTKSRGCAVSWLLGAVSATQCTLGKCAVNEWGNICDAHFEVQEVSSSVLSKCLLNEWVT